MSDLRKAAEMALKYFEGAYGLEDMEFKIKEALRTALAQGVVQEIKPYDDGLKPNYYTEPEKWVKHDPVAHLWECIGKWTAMIAHDGENANLAPTDWLVDAVKAATAPPKREWVGLTDEEVEILIKTAWNEEQAFAGFVRSIEAKLKEKNGG
jgi:hypothetical protein